MKFSIKDFFSKCDQIHGFDQTADLVTFTEEILKEKLHFLCSVVAFKGLSVVRNCVRLESEPSNLSLVRGFQKMCVVKFVDSQ